MGTGQQSGTGPTQIPTGGLPEPTPKSFYGSESVDNKLKFKSLVYPKDLGPDNFYPDCVCFTIQKRTGVSIDAITAAGAAGVQEAEDQFFKNTPEHQELKKLFDKQKKELTMKGASAKAIKEGKEKIKKDYEAKHPDSKISENMFELIGSALNTFATKIATSQTAALARGKSGANIIGSIYMNMPNGITFNEKANWSGSELGFMGKMSKDFVGGTGQAGDAAAAVKGALAGGAGSMVGAAIGAIPSIVSKLGIQGGMFGAAIGAVAAGSPLQKGAEAALGVAQNPYMEMMFSGIGFRAFTFDFIMRPKDTDEVQEVAEILHKFRTFTKPTFVEGSLGKSFMDYPMEFQIEFLTGSGITSFDYIEGKKSDAAAHRGGKEYVSNPFVPKLKDCVCDSVSSNYTPQSVWAAHDQGVPVAVNLSLSFQETELVMAEDVWNDRKALGGY